MNDPMRGPLEDTSPPEDRRQLAKLVGWSLLGLATFTVVYVTDTAEWFALGVVALCISAAFAVFLTDKPERPDDMERVTRIELSGELEACIDRFEAERIRRQAAEHALRHIAALPSPTECRGCGREWTDPAVEQARDYVAGMDQ